MEMLELRDLHMTFNPGTVNEKVALNGVSLTMEAGDFATIVGPNGAGKSTLFNAITGGFIADEGSITLGGEDITFAPEYQRSRVIGHLFQDPLKGTAPNMTIEENIVVVPKLLGWDPQKCRDRARELMSMIKLDPKQYLHRYPRELSGGQAQRVGIARAIVGRPKLIICDEPVSALDVSIQAQVINLLMELQEKMGLALVFISHNLAVVRHISHDVMVMCLGRVVEQAPRNAFYARPLHPYSQALMDAVPEPDPRREKGRVGTALAGELPSVLNPPPGCVFASRCPKATDLCRQTRPDLRTVAPGRQAACHFIEA